MKEKKQTFKVMKEKREVPGRVRAGVKEYNRLKKKIKGAIRDVPKSIPQIAAETGLPGETVVFYLMTLMKYGEVEVDRLDDMDEYYFYKAAGGGNDKGKS